MINDEKKKIFLQMLFIVTISIISDEKDLLFI